MDNLYPGAGHQGASGTSNYAGIRVMHLVPWNTGNFIMLALVLKQIKRVSFSRGLRMGVDIGKKVETFVVKTYLYCDQRDTQKC